MTELERIRHSAAHVLATAILKIWPEAQFAAGPPVENGFYYDVELPHRISPEDFEKIEAEMKKETKANHTFERVEVSRPEALALAHAGELAALGPRPAASKFKLDIVENIPEDEKITLYRNGEFTDLCAGPHVMRTGNIGAFKLTNVASAYYKGDEKNPQLQRIYGTAFKNKTQLDEYFAMLEEAKKRDHRKLGKELQLFTFDDDVGPGLPLWLPRGAAIIEELEKLAKETEFAAGYQRVRTPHIARENLYLTSGHLPYYAESMFPPMELQEVSGRVGVSPAGSGILPERTSERTAAQDAQPGGQDAHPTRENVQTALPTPGATYTRRRRLPHFEQPSAIYAITFTTHNKRHLSSESRSAVLNALRHFHTKSYTLIAAVVMPDHVHLLFQPWIKEQDDKGENIFWSLGDLMHSIKSFSAKEVNRIEGTSGVLWEQERFDRYVRGDRDLEEKFHYILSNPERAGLLDPEKGYPCVWTQEDEVQSGKMPDPAGGTPTLPENAPTSPDDQNVSGRVGVSPAGEGVSPLRTSAKVDRYYLKAMNCPHHHKLFAAVPHSYRDLPLRLAEYGTNYRYEQSGELFGLMRVRSLQMNDAHIYCTEEQFETEFKAVNDMYLKYFKIFGIEKYVMRFSTHDPAKLGQKFVDNPELWKKTEDMVRGVLQRSGINYIEVPNEAAFYGPKIDVQVWSAIGREFSIATNQVDFAVPARFGLVYKDRDNTEKTPLCIHRAPLGTHERFIGFLIEHYAGNFPLWLSPEQVRILPIGNEPDLVSYSRAILDELRANYVRAELDESSDKINGKIQRAEQMKVHTMLVIGKRDMEGNAVSVRVHGKGNLGAKPRDEVIADLLRSIRERAA
ncbi:MAG: His/Gly/Thr/Pro-type tRNA ligase C-terminal domain-containing protein [Verrucomicrobiota bacterium]|nr:His/Gly/Thr/Pro-type tRNA ligase C-terminal domain-containing protein [Verrucomicrobiota bacterium]